MNSIDKSDALGYEGKKVVISGCSSGMGAATARILIDLGAEVIASGITPVDLPVKEFIAADLRDKAAIDSLVAAIPVGVDALFSCAGVPGAPFSDVDSMLINFVGQRYLIESMVPKMSAGSAVATIASPGGMGWQQQLGNWIMELLHTDGFDAGKGWCEANADKIAGGYAPSKQAMSAWICWRACSLIGDGIRLNTINPGPTITPMMPQFEENSGSNTIEWAAQPINRRSTPEEQAWPLVMLNSPRASYVNGHIFSVDGGFFGGLQTGQLRDRKSF